jgi:hypothetical protein
MVILPFVFVYSAIMNMNGKLLAMFACFFYLTVILIRKMRVKKIELKILPKDGKRMRPVQILDFGGTRITILSKVPFIWIAHA